MREAQNNPDGAGTIRAPLSFVTNFLLCLLALPHPAPRLASPFTIARIGSLRTSDPAYVFAGLQWALPFNPSYCSLIVELQFYALLPFLFLLTRGLKARHAAGIIVGLLFIIPFVVRNLTWPAESTAKDMVGFLMTRFPCQLDYFAWGVLFAAVFVPLSKLIGRTQVLALFGYLGAAVLILTIVLAATWSRTLDIVAQPTQWSTEVFHLLAGTAAFLLLFFVFDSGCTAAKLLARPSLRFVGIVSYEWFLFHMPVVYLFKDLIGNTQGNLLLYLVKTVGPLALTFVFSVLVYRYFSLPLLNRIRRTEAPARPRQENPLCELLTGEPVTPTRD